MSDFNWISPYYDSLAKLAFGDQLFLSQSRFLHYIPANSKLLIVGGGTGRFLTNLPSNLKYICYVEPSYAMLKRSQSSVRKQKIDFHQGRFERFQTIDKFDYVLAPFYLDLYNNEQLTGIINRVKGILVRDGHLIVADFVNSNQFIHKAVLRTMYFFFRMAANVRNSQLPDWKFQIIRNGFIMRENATFYSGFVHATLFRKNEA